jgi:hypothetical protein
MVIDDLDIFRTSSRPAEAHPKLVVQANAVLPGPISLELFKAVPWWNTQVFEPSGDLQLTKLASRP